MTKSRFSDPEDAKLESLARATLQRSGSDQAAALRDTTGRNHVASNISLPNYSVDALISVFTVAMATQIVGIEAIVVVGGGKVNVKPAREYAPHCLIWHIDMDGEISAL